ncbi:MAG: hypothetical protein ABMB14_03715 [Myxococcota bacterium]
MSEAEGSATAGQGSQVGWMVGAAVGGLLLVVLLVQNVMQGRAIDALRTDLETTQRAVVDGRRADGVAALGGLANAANHKAKSRKGKGKGAGKARKTRTADLAAGGDGERKGKAKAGKGAKQGAPADGADAIPAAP